MCPLIASLGMDWALRNKMPRTLSGPEGSSNKWIFLCAAGQPSPTSAELLKGIFLLDALKASGGNYPETLRVRGIRRMLAGYALRYEL